MKMLTFGPSAHVTVAPPLGPTLEENAWDIYVEVTDSLGATAVQKIDKITVSKQVNPDKLSHFLYISRSSYFNSLIFRLKPPEVY